MSREGSADFPRSLSPFVRLNRKTIAPAALGSFLSIAPLAELPQAVAQPILAEQSSPAEIPVSPEFFPELNNLPRTLRRLIRELVSQENVLNGFIANTFRLTQHPNNRIKAEIDPFILELHQLRINYRNLRADVIIFQADLLTPHPPAFFLNKLHHFQKISFGYLAISQTLQEEINAIDKKYSLSIDGGSQEL